MSGWVGASRAQLLSADLSTFRLAENGSVADAGPPKLGDMKVVKTADIATPLLLLAAMNSTPTANQAVLKFVKAGGAGSSAVPFLEITLKRPVITGFEVTAAAGGDTPQETVSISYDEVCVTHRPQDSQGNVGPAVTRCWNAATGSEGSL